jgi:hypothetical protein
MIKIAAAVVGSLILAQAATAVADTRIVVDGPVVRHEWGHRGGNWHRGRAWLVDETYRVRRPAPVVVIRPAVRVVTPAVKVVTTVPVVKVVPARTRLRPWSVAWYRWCSATHRSFNPKNGTYLGRDGRKHFCEG